MSRPVVRKWEASVARGDIDAWVDTFRDRVMGRMRTIDGFREVSFLAEREGDPCHVTVLTKWDDMDAVRAFAGADPAQAVVPEFMAPFFAEHDARATFHDQVLLETKA